MPSCCQRRTPRPAEPAGGGRGAGTDPLARAAVPRVGRNDPCLRRWQKYKRTATAEARYLHRCSVPGCRTQCSHPSGEASLADLSAPDPGVQPVARCVRISVAKRASQGQPRDLTVFPARRGCEAWLAVHPQPFLRRAGAGMPRSSGALGAGIRAMVINTSNASAPARG